MIDDADAAQGSLKLRRHILPDGAAEQDVAQASGMRPLKNTRQGEQAQGKLVDGRLLDTVQIAMQHGGTTSPGRMMRLS